MKIDRQDLISRLTYLFRIQATLGEKNYRRFQREHLQELLSSVVVIGIEVLYATREQNGSEVLSQIELNQKTEKWKELIEHHFNEAILEMDIVKKEGYPISLAIPKLELALICQMTELADAIIAHENARENTAHILQVSRRPMDGTSD